MKEKCTIGPFIQSACNQEIIFLSFILGVKSNYKYTGFKKMEYMTKFKPNQQ